MVNKMKTNKALQQQFKQDKLEGTTLSTKFAEWIKEQPDERLEEIQSREIIDQIDETIKVNRVVINQEVKVTKSSLAKVIFEEEMKVGLVRKTVLGRFMNEAGLTVAGANTYYNNLRDKHGLVNHKG